MEHRTSALPPSSSGAHASACRTDRYETQVSLNSSDLDREWRLSPAKLLSLLQVARWEWLEPLWLPAIQDGYRFLMKAQLLLLHGGNDRYLPLPPCLTVSQQLTGVGRSSLDTSFSVKIGDALIASGVAVMVCISGADMRPAEMPGSFRSLLRPPPTDPLPFPMRRSTLDTVLRRAAAAAGPARASLPLVPRFSDEDANLHVNQSRYAAFVDDAVRAAAAGGIDGQRGWSSASMLAIALQYDAELHALERSEVELVEDAGGSDLDSATSVSSASCARFTIRKASGAVTTRGWFLLGDELERFESLLLQPLSPASSL